MADWIPVEDRLPEPLTDVLALAAATGDYYIAHTEYGIWYKSDGYFVNRPVTHWQPLPQPPAQPAKIVNSAGDDLVALARRRGLVE